MEDENLEMVALKSLIETGEELMTKILRGEPGWEGELKAFSQRVDRMVPRGSAARRCGETLDRAVRIGAKIRAKRKRAAK